jgi:hypothetical protein
MISGIGFLDFEALLVYENVLKEATASILGSK